MNTSGTYLALGQRYAMTGLEGWRADQQVLVLAIDLDAALGVCVTYRCPSGQLVRGTAAVFESAVARGEIVPVVGSRRVACC